jgi:hypothetical protein
MIYLELNDEQSKKAEEILRSNGVDEINYKGTLIIEAKY